MKKSSYMDRAMKSRDPRFKQILGKLGYDRRDMVADEQPVKIVSQKIEKEEHEVDHLQEAERQPTLMELRAEYEKVVGRRPFYGWNEEVLTQKIKEAKP